VLAAASGEPTLRPRHHLAAASRRAPGSPVYVRRKIVASASTRAATGDAPPDHQQISAAALVAARAGVSTLQQITLNRP
jgi:hypothetical protein